MRIAREGIPFILVGLALTLLLWIVGWRGTALVALLLTSFIVFFFRDPERTASAEPGAVLAPGDGRVVAVRSEGPATLVSIFLSLFDVHVNRSPISGVVQDMEYRRGRFRAAFRESARRENEQTRIVVSGEVGTVTFRQIAGLVARRIVCRVRPGQTLRAGERIGLICFGSRVDVLLPPPLIPTVREGDRVRGGLTVVGRLPGEESSP
jgi:phosphatidylserine decarboxylase